MHNFYSFTCIACKLNNIHSEKNMRGVLYGRDNDNQ